MFHLLGLYQFFHVLASFMTSLQIGLVRSEFEHALADHPDVFRISTDKIELSPKLKSFEERSAALDVAVRKMRAERDLESLREEEVT